MTSLPEPNDEQLAIIHSAKDGKCIQVDALPGTGKSTVSFMCVRELGISSIILSYNKALADETNANIKKYNLKGCRAFTYHSFFGSNLRETLKDDDAILQKVKQWRKGVDLPARSSAKLGVLDELQDMNPLYYEALSYVLPFDIQIMAVGDRNQILYTFYADNPSDTKYLINAPYFFGTFTGDREWTNLKLRISYRLTPNVTQFANFVWGTDIISGNTRSPNVPIEYWHINAFDPVFVARVSKIIDEVGIENVLILSPTNPNSNGGNKRPMDQQINNLLKCTDENGVRKYNVHTKDSKGNDRADDYRNKLRCWTYCGSKGIEAKVVIVFSFETYNGNPTPLNQMGVALTRAKDRLIVVHGTDKRKRSSLPFYPPLDNEAARRFSEQGVVKFVDKIPEDATAVRTCEIGPLAVTDIKHISAMTMERLLSHGRIEIFQPAGYTLEVDSLVKFSTGKHSTTENVTSIYGTAIPFHIQWQRDRCIPDIDSMLNPVKISQFGKYGVQQIKKAVYASGGYFEDESKLEEQFAKIVTQKRYTEPFLEAKDAMLLLKNAGHFENHMDSFTQWV